MIYRYLILFLFPAKFESSNNSQGVRSSLPKLFCEKGVLKNFAKFTGKHVCQSLFFNEVADLRPATLLKKRLWRRFFPVNFAKFFRTPFFIEHLWWLLLKEFLVIETDKKKGKHVEKKAKGTFYK